MIMQKKQSRVKGMDNAGIGRVANIALSKAARAAPLRR